MSFKKTKGKKATKGYDIKYNPALTETAEIAMNEEWANFMTRVGQVSSLVKDMASGDKPRAEAANKLADKYLEGKVIVDENVEMKVKDDRTVINQKAFKSIENKDTVTNIFIFYLLLQGSIAIQNIITLECYLYVEVNLSVIITLLQMRKFMKAETAQTNESLFGIWSTLE